MEKFPLKIKSNDPDAIIRVLNNRDRIVKQSEGSFNEDLPVGIYTMQLISNGVLQEEIIKHRDGPTDIVKEATPIYSSALLNGYSSSHEYYTDNAKLYSQTTTGDLGNIHRSEQASIFIFFRFASFDQARRLLDDRNSIFQGFQLLDSDFDKMADMDASTICRQNLDHGWGAISLKLKPGLYYVHYSDEKVNRLIPVYLFKGWQTQMFLMLGKTPVFETLRILMGKINIGFDPLDEVNRELDRALLKLQNRQYKLPPEAAQKLAYKKWENPLLGMLWCYIYLREVQPDPENDRMFQTIMGNLEGPILNSKDIPDLRAIRLMKAVRDENPASNIVISNPPLFKVGFKGVVRTSYIHDHVIPEDSRMSLFAPKLCLDTAWTTFDGTELVSRVSPAKIMVKAMIDGQAADFTHIVTRKLRKPPITFRKQNIKDDFFKSLDKEFSGTEFKTITPRVGIEVVADILVRMARDVDKIDNWEVISLLTSINANLSNISTTEMAVRDIAKDIGLPPATVRELSKAIVRMDRYAPVVKTMSKKLNVTVSPKVMDVVKRFADN